LQKAKNLGKTGILLRKIKEADESPVSRIHIQTTKFLFGVLSIKNLNICGDYKYFTYL
jgi:hypothetical protein